MVEQSAEMPKRGVGGDHAETNQRVPEILVKDYDGAAIVLGFGTRRVWDHHPIPRPKQEKHNDQPHQIAQQLIHSAQSHPIWTQQVDARLRHTSQGQRYDRPVELVPDWSWLDKSRSWAEDHERSMLCHPKPADGDTQGHKLSNRIERRYPSGALIGTAGAFPASLYRKCLVPGVFQASGIPAIGKLA